MAFTHNRPRAGDAAWPRFPALQVMILLGLLVLLVHGWPWSPPLP